MIHQNSYSPIRLYFDCCDTSIIMNFIVVLQSDCLACIVDPLLNIVSCIVNSMFHTSKKIKLPLLIFGVLLQQAREKDREIAFLWFQRTPKLQLYISTYVHLYISLVLITTIILEDLRGGKGGTDKVQALTSLGKLDK